MDSCLALGGEAPALAEALFAWCAETDRVDRALPDVGEDYGYEPEWLLALLLLRVARDPEDHRVDVLAHLLAERSSWPPEAVGAELAGAVTARLWYDLIGRLLGPARVGRPALDELLRRIEPA